MFICFEGIDGAGKSTQARMLYHRLKNAGVDVELVADPGTTKIGTSIRQILLDSDAPISPAAQMLLFSAARAELAAYIKSRLAGGVVVICDRWVLSTLVYQCELNQISRDLVLAVYNETAQIRADICFLMDIDPELAASRMGQPRDRYERSSFAEKQRMRQAYKRNAETNADACEIHLIDASFDPQDTHAAVYDKFCAARLQRGLSAERKCVPHPV